MQGVEIMRPYTTSFNEISIGHAFAMGKLWKAIGKIQQLLFAKWKRHSKWMSTEVDVNTNGLFNNIHWGSGNRWLYFALLRNLVFLTCNVLAGVSFTLSTFRWVRVGRMVAFPFLSIHSTEIFLCRFSSRRTKRKCRNGP